MFDRNLQKFRDLSVDIDTWISGISKEKWSMTYDEDGRRYGHMTTNLSECVNKVLKGCRIFLITTLVKATYSHCREYFVERGRQVQREMRQGQIYCQKIIQALQKNQDEAYSHIVHVHDITD